MAFAAKCTVLIVCNKMVLRFCIKAVTASATYFIIEQTNSAITIEGGVSVTGVATYSRDIICPYGVAFHLVTPNCFFTQACGTERDGRSNDVMTGKAGARFLVDSFKRSVKFIRSGRFTTRNLEVCACRKKPVFI